MYGFLPVDLLVLKCVKWESPLAVYCLQCFFSLYKGCGGDVASTDELFEGKSDNTWASMSRCLISVMDFLKVSLSPEMKASSSSARLQGLVTMNWAIWSFRLLRDWTAAKEAKELWLWRGKHKRSRQSIFPLLSSLDRPCLISFSHAHCSPQNNPSFGEEGNH